MSLPNESISISRTSLYSEQYSTNSGNSTVYNEAFLNSGSYSKTVLRDATVGFRDPNRGRLRPLPYKRVEKDLTFFTGVRFKSTPGVPRGTAGYYAERLSGPIEGVSSVENLAPATFSPDTLTVMRDRLNTKLLTKVKGTSVNLAVAFGERRQTVDLIAGTAGRIAGALKSLKRGDFMAAARHLGVAGRKRANSRFNSAYAKDRAASLGSGWLQLQYGWKPLLSDIYGLCEDIANKQVDPYTMTVRAQVKYKELVSLSSKAGSTSDGLNVLTLARGTRNLKLTGGITFFRTPGAPQDLPRLGITNPLSVAWELLPYSFVIDWFLPIGNWIETLDAPLGIQFFSGFISELATADITAQRFYSGTASGVAYDGVLNSAVRYSSFERKVLSSLPDVGLPHFKNPVSTGHMFNALALLAQVVNRR